MENKLQFRIAFLWLLIVIGYIYHGQFHLSELLYGVDIRIPNTNGQIPMGMHIFRILVELVTLLMVLLTLYIPKKGFKAFSFVWAILLGVLNLFHLGETLVKEFNDLSQIVLLTFVLAANILLIADTKKWQKI